MYGACKLKIPTVIIMDCILDEFNTPLSAVLSRRDPYGETSIDSARNVQLKVRIRIGLFKK